MDVETEMNCWNENREKYRINLIMERSIQFVHKNTVMFHVKRFSMANVDMDVFGVSLSSDNRLNY